MTWYHNVKCSQEGNRIPAIINIIIVLMESSSLYVLPNISTNSIM